MNDRILSESVGDRALSDYQGYQAARDAEYLDHCGSAGVEPLPNHRREFPQVVAMPGQLLDCGARVGTQSLREMFVESTAIDAIDAGLRSVESERAGLSKNLLLSPEFTWFLISSKSGDQMLHRFSALAVRSGLAPRDVYNLWPELTEAKLRRARRDLEQFLDGKKTTAGVRAPAAVEKPGPLCRKDADER